MVGAGRQRPSTARRSSALHISGTVTAVSAPEASRQLFGELVVVSDQGAVLGRGSVIIGAVG